jgi:hypothetical protein
MIGNALLLTLIHILSVGGTTWLTPTSQVAVSVGSAMSGVKKTQVA